MNPEISEVAEAELALVPVKAAEPSIDMRERWVLRRGLRASHVHKADIGSEEVRQGPRVGHLRERQGREDRSLALDPGGSPTDA